MRRRDAQPTLSCLRSRTAATVELTLLGPAHFECRTATLKAGTRTPSCATQTTNFSISGYQRQFIHTNAFAFNAQIANTNVCGRDTLTLTSALMNLGMKRWRTDCTK